MIPRRVLSVLHILSKQSAREHYGCGAVSSSERGEQGADFVLDIGLSGIVESGGDLLAEDRPIAAAEPMDGDLDGSFGHTELGGERGIRAVFGAVYQDILEPLEKRPAF